ncbi:MAG TPA: TOBE domain-containing protein, partial [Solirubrobacteraceae bacterium]
MDEPLSNLDAKLRVQVRAEIAELQADLGVTTLYVTHDQTEAMTMGDRVAVMRKGELQQVAPPQELYDRPVNLFVAGFIGSPAMNLLAAQLERDGDGLVANLGAQRIPLGSEATAEHPELRAYEGREIIVGIRPEDLEDRRLADHPDAERCHLDGQVVLREALGSEIIVHFRTDAREAVTEDVRELAADAGDERKLARGDADGDGGAKIVGRFSPRSEVRTGDSIEVAVDTRGLHFFDPETGRGIYDQTSTMEAR